MGTSQNFCSAAICTTSLQKQGRDLFVHSLFHFFLEQRRFWPVPSKKKRRNFSDWCTIGVLLVNKCNVGNFGVFRHCISVGVFRHKSTSVVRCMFVDMTGKC